MKALVIDRGIFRFGRKGKSEPTWKSDPTGKIILIGDLIEDTEHPENNHIDNADMFNVAQRLSIMDEIAKRLNLPPAGDGPDVRELAKALMEQEGVCICTACPGPGDCEWCEIDAMMEEMGSNG